MIINISEVYVASIFSARATVETQVSKGMTMCRSKRLDHLPQEMASHANKVQRLTLENFKPRKEHTLLLLQKMFELVKKSAMSILHEV